MRKLTLMMATTLDAKVAGPDGNLEWFRNDAGIEDTRLSLLHSVDAMIFGRVAYELLAGFWPTATPAAHADGFTSPERAEEFIHLLNTIPKIVVSHGRPPLPWGPAQSISGDDVVGAVRGLKAKEGRDLVLFAGAELATTAIDADLVDEYRLMVHPTVLGKGLPLFDQVRSERALELVDATTFGCGVVELRYRPELAGQS